MSLRRVVRDSAIAVAVAASYFVAAKLGLRLAFVHASATPVWPPTGIALATLLILGNRMWPGIFAGAYLANITTAGNWATSLGIATGNTLEGVLGAYLVRRFANGWRVFERAPDIFRFALLAGMISTAVSATFGVTSLSLGGFADWSRYGAIWLTWWLGDAAGALIVAPLLILWSLNPKVSWNERKAWEGVLLLFSLIAVGLFVFGFLLPDPSKHFPLEFLCFPVLVWAAFRFRPRDSATAIAILSGIAIVGTLRGLGPFVADSQNESLLLLQAFMAVISVMLLAVAASVAESRRIQGFVRKINEELEERVARRTEQLRSANQDLRDQVRERVRTQEELQQSEARLRKAQQLARIGSWEWDIERNAVWWSEELYTIYGLDPRSFGASYEAFLERVHPDDRDLVHGAVGAALRDGKPFSFEHRIERPDGIIMTLLAQGRVLVDERGKSIRMMGTGQDISDQKRAEEQRAQLIREQSARREAEEANRLKDEFLAMLSHELRTPLHAIVGWAQLLGEGGLDAEKTAQAIETIDRNARIQTKLVSDLLDISRMTSGKLDLKLQPVDLGTVVARALDTMRPTAQAKAVVLDSDLERVGPVLGDSDRLQQVVWNLVSNAIKFSPDGGHVRVSLVRDGSRARIRVEDEGPGIDPRFLPHVFDRFRQQDASNTRRQGGMGLGLTIVKHLVDLHGGSVAANNRAHGRGSEFAVTLPLAATTAPLDATQQVAPVRLNLVAADAEDGFGTPFRGRRILVVEDDRDSRELISMLLLRCGAEVLAVGSCREALAVLENEKADLLISDIEMPGENGYDLIAKVRALPRDVGGAVPAVALTAHAGPENATKAMRAGYQAHLPKPVGLRELVSTVMDLIADPAPRQ